ncbi:MAG: hypothetical protein J1F38_08790 [Muribaculaceae bacterium]|nr:hypothetical protein [Muribaculaceae bacterium]
MKVEIEDITEEVKSRLFKYKSKKKKSEIPLSTLWDDATPKVFSEEDEIPPDKWDFNPRK